MVEQVSCQLCLQISSAAVVLTKIIVMFLVISTAQVTTKKNGSRRQQIFCEQRGPLEKKYRTRLNSLQEVFHCVYFPLLSLNSPLIEFRSSVVPPLPQVQLSHHQSQPTTRPPQQEQWELSPRIRPPSTGISRGGSQPQSTENQPPSSDHCASTLRHPWSSPGQESRRQNPVSYQASGYTEDSTGRYLRPLAGPYQQPPFSPGPLQHHNSNVAPRSDHRRHDGYPALASARNRERSQSPPRRSVKSPAHRDYSDSESPPPRDLARRSH